MLDSALLIYKQAILPIFDYPGFMLLFLGVENKRDLQIMQNDALRSCYNVRLNDRMSILDLHNRAKLSSLEQRRIRQLLGLQFLLYKKDTDSLITGANTHSQQKYVFKVDTKVGKKYERSPYYIGTRLWNKLGKNVQESDDVYVFKNKITRLYKHYITRNLSNTYRQILMPRLLYFQDTRIQLYPYCTIYIYIYSLVFSLLYNYVTIISTIVIISI